ncbi:hypothetical protein AB0C34_18195 [Nocardia sp. NPDC049220]|uniref:hypothetical protein n=1 Tax=Nocardia sp. NPDC049220 TaxID=3155273 RepID=UPI0033C50570
MTSHNARPECAMRRAAAWRAVPGRKVWRRPRLGGDPSTAHRAAADCRALLGLLSAIAADDHTVDLGLLHTYMNANGKGMQLRAEWDDIARRLAPIVAEIEQLIAAAQRADG